MEEVDSLSNELDNTPTSHPETDETKVMEKLKIEEKHQIAKAINSLLHHVTDIETSVRIFLPLASKLEKRQMRKLHRELSKLGHALESEEDGKPPVTAIAKVLDASRRLIRISNSDVPEILRSSLFLGIFSAYDAFTGDLLAAIYRKKPELFNKLNRAVSVSEILQFDSFEELKEVVLQNEIESFRRKSYVEQFEDLQSTFGVELKAFDRWPDFVECSQRRNLITHCGGIISEQYLKMCKKEGCLLPTSINAGDKLDLNSDYLLLACDLVMEVGLKLGQTLWRKLFPTELGEIESHLNTVIYNDCLQTEMWDRAIVYGEFAINQKRFSNDVARKISIVNYIIGLKFSGQNDKAKTVLETIDWSGAASDFKLAVAILSDEYERAASIMNRIGKRGELVFEHAYHEWPLFREFRKTEQFFQAYEEVYGYPFALELQRTTDKTQAIASENACIEGQPESNEN